MNAGLGFRKFTDRGGGFAPYKCVMSTELGLMKKEVDGVERQQYLSSCKTPDELKNHLDKAPKITRAKFDVVVLS